MDGWITEEMQSADLRDKRLERRLNRLCCQNLPPPDSDIAFGDEYGLCFILHACLGQPEA